MDQIKRPTLEEFNEVVSGTSPETIEYKDEPKADVAIEESEDSAPLKAELERVKSKKSPAEKALNSLYFNAEKALELGIDITKDEKLKKILGIPGTSNNEVIEDTVSNEKRYLTEEDLENYLRKQNVQKSATQLAEEISDPLERELVEYHLQNTIKSTGDAQEDLQIAKTLANSVRDKKLRELADIKPVSKNFSSASGASATVVKQSEPEFTEVEKQFLATGRVTKEEILAYRTKK